MKKYNTLYVVVITILLVALLTWILPITYLQGELVSGERMQAGIVNIFSYPVYTFYNFIYILVYLLGIGGLYGLLNKTGAYRLLLDKVVKVVKKHQTLWLILTVVVLSIIVSLTGYTFELLILLPFIAAIILLLGYDKMTAALVTVGSISTGIIGNTFSKLVVGSFIKILKTVTYENLIVAKLVLLVVCDAILIFNIIRHAKNVEKESTVEESFLVPKKVTSRKIKVWPLVVSLSVFMVILILASINWVDAFKVNFFTTLLDSIKETKVLSKYIILTISLLVVLYNVLISIYRKKKEAKKETKTKEEVKTKLMTKRRLIVTICFGVVAFIALLKIMLEDVFKATNILTKALELIKVDGLINGFTFDKLLGNIKAFGEWGYPDYLVWMFVLLLAIKFIYRIKFDEVIDNIGNGFKNVLYATLVVMLGYTVLMLTASHPVILTIVRPILELTDGLSVLSYPFVTLFGALFNTDFTYYESHAFTLNYALNYFTTTSTYPLCLLMTQAMYGLAILFAPTSAALLFSLSVLDIKYTSWLKKIWMIILEFLLVCFVAFIVVSQFFI